MIMKINVTETTVPTCRWPTRVFATDCLRKIIVACEEDPIHFDLEKAREARAKKKGM